ncbi:hypothetical protein FRC11_009023 [Ceratobasidium sp. 423]|nr:hypothetical protein FRC11_009023 [Ceratobasidium sp. 423]
MTSLADGSPPMTIDLGRLAATIAFASETLATAAEALAEAAREILDASQALGGCRPIGTSSFMYSTDSDDGEPDKESRSETTDQESSGKGDPHGLGHGAETGAPPRIKIALDPGHRAETPHSQAHNQPSTINTPSEGENHANSCGDGGTLPLSSQPGQPSPSLVDDTATTARSQIDHAIKNEPSPPRLMDGQNNHYNRSYTQE